MKKAIIDIGGGMRDIYGAGAFDMLLENGVSFDYCIGVSGGSANVASYLAGQYGRNYMFYAEYSQHKDYMGISSLLNNGAFLNLDYIYSTLSESGGLYPLDFETMKKNGDKLCMVATHAESGLPRYFTIDDFSADDFTSLKASCAIPMICHKVDYNGEVYFDGGISDPIPYKKALSEGCDKLCVIIPKNLERLRSEHYGFSRAVLMKYPKLAEALINRYKLFSEQLSELKELEKEGRAIIVTPEIKTPSMLTRDPGVLTAFYRQGRQDMLAAIENGLFCK